MIIPFTLVYKHGRSCYPVTYKALARCSLRIYLVPYTGCSVKYYWLPINCIVNKALGTATQLQAIQCDY